MDLNWVWQTALIIIVGTLLLRVAGRKTIARMSIAQVVLMVAIGTLLIQPVSGKNLWITFATGAVLVFTLLFLEYVQLKSDRLESFITGKSKILIEDGNINEETMKKLRMTIDQLEMNLRQKNVTKITDVQYATLEPNGQIGYTLKQEAQPVTKREFQQLQQSINNILANQPQLKSANQSYVGTENLQDQQKDIFTEIEDKEQKYDPPKHLQ